VAAITGHNVAVVALLAEQAFAVAMSRHAARIEKSVL
jgi:hypothetical protein